MWFFFHTVDSEKKMESFFEKFHVNHYSTIDLKFLSVSKKRAMKENDIYGHIVNNE